MVMVTFALPPSFARPTETKRVVFLEEFGLGACARRSGGAKGRKQRGWRFGLGSVRI